MLISREKKQNNIAEYILYMWQVEDMIRANNFDIRKIEQNIINQYQQPETVKKEIKLWYEQLLSLMIQEKVVSRGHLQFLRNQIFDLLDLHLYLMGSPFEMKYQSKYNKALPYIKEYKEKLMGAAENEIDVCFHGLYAWLLMRLRKAPISTHTEDAFKSFSELLAVLSQRYHEREVDELKIY